MADLKTTYQDDILDTSVNEKRKYNMIQNADGTVSFEDVTTYSQIGDSFGAADINATNEKVNEVNSNLSDFVNYSLDETIIGAWIDGKPIYRKFLYANQQIPNSIDVSSLNIETIVKIGGFVNSYGNIIPIQFNDGITRMPAYYNSGQKTIVFAPNSDSHVGYMFIEYTKTTD